MYCHRDLADCRGNSFHTSRSCIADRKDSRDAGFEQKWRAIKRPLITSSKGGKVRTSDDETLVVQHKEFLKPLGSRRRSRHHEDVADRTAFCFSARVILPCDMFKVTGT